jgi:hypothetical protein
MLSLAQLQAILFHPSLTVTSEDSLYQFISNRIRTDRDFSVLLESVNFENLSIESIHDFVE